MSFTFFNLGGGGGGAETVDVVAGETVAAGQVVYLDEGVATKGRAYLADADNAYSSSYAAILGIVTTGAAAGATCTIQTSGTVSGLSGLTSGRVYGLSSTAGALATTAAAPLIGVATSATDLQLTGVVTGLSSLVAGESYGSDASGVLTAGQADSIGYAISATTLQIRGQFGASGLWPAPLVYYRFASDPSSATAVDSCGNSYDGTLTAGSFSYTTSTVGTSRTVLDYTATTGNGLSLPTLASPSGTDFTWSFWLNADTKSNYEYIVTQKCTGGSAITSGRYARIFNSKFEADSNQNLFSATQISTTAWQNWVWTMSGTVATIYLNGAANATGTMTARTRANDDCSVFGVYNDTGSSFQYDGLACDIAYWDVALTPGQVSNIYNGGTPPLLA